MADSKSFILSELAEHLGAQLVGDGSCQITGIAELQHAQVGDVAFLANPVYKKYLSTSKASAVILSPDLADATEANKLLLANPYLGYAQLSALFAPVFAAAGVHPSAVIHPSVILGANVNIGAHAVVEEGVELAQGVSVGAGCYIGAHSQIGEGSFLYPNVTIYHGVSVGQRAIFHAGVVVGADGFGIAPDRGRWVKVHQLGGVVIGDDVELGANTCVDRGAIGNTEIANGVKTDNLVQIAHNVKIGPHTVMAGCSAVAGSTVIGASCAIGGGAGIVGHLRIAEGVTVTAMSLVTKSINEPGTYSSGTPVLASKNWRKSAVRFSQLDEIYQRLKRLEEQ